MSIINNKYKLIKQIGSGSFGTIFEAIHILKGNKVAIKIEPTNSPFKMLKNETIVYELLNKVSYIPSIKWFGKDANNYYMVIELLGQSLREVFLNRKDLLNSQTNITNIIKIGIQLIDILEYIHYYGLVHRDIKPDNFLFGCNQMNQLFLIDFGMCTRFSALTEPKKTHSLIGSKLYASEHSHQCIELNRRDDMISLFYMLCHLELGNLPWEYEHNDNSILNMKLNCIELQNSVFYSGLIQMKQLQFCSAPNYKLLKYQLSCAI